MPLLPFHKIVLITSLTVDAVTDLLHRKLSAKQSILSGKPPPMAAFSYAGIMQGNSFKMQRMINYRNSFNPVVKGYITATNNGLTSITIVFRPSVSAIIFMGVWLGLIGFIALAITLGLLFQAEPFSGKNFSLLFFIPHLMFLFGYGLMYWSFNREYKISREVLMKLWNANCCD